MALWGNAKLFLCILIITGTLAQLPTDCCLKVKNKEIQKNLVIDYRRQISGQGCSIDATIFVTRRGKTLCVPPNKPWVQALMSHVDKLKKHCKETNSEGKRCARVKLV